MRKPRNVGKFRAAMGIGSLAILLAVSGCGTPEQRADKDAQEAIASADAMRAKATDANALDAVQKKYDSIAMTPDISPALKAIIDGRRAQLRYERAMAQVNDLSATELQITQAISDIERLALQVTGAQQSVAALQKYEPTAQLSDLRARQMAMAGDADHLTWPVAGDTTGATTTESTGAVLPTLTKLNSDIDALKSQIDQNKSQSADLHSKSTDLSTQAESLSRQAEGETGDKQLQDTIKASEMHRDAAIIDSQVDTLASQLDALKTRLESLQTQQTTVQASLDALDSQIAALQQSWQSVQQQIDAQKKVQQALIGSDSQLASGDEVTIASRAADLNKLLTLAGDQRAAATDELNKCVDDFATAANEAENVRSKLRDQTRLDTGNDPDAPVWAEEMETLHPMAFEMQRVSTMQNLASMAASEAEIQFQLTHMLDGYSVSASDSGDTMKRLNVTVDADKSIAVPGLLSMLDPSITGAPTPAAVTAIKHPSADDLKKMEQDVNDQYAAVLDAYSKRYGADIGAAAARRNDIALMARATAGRQWAQYSLIIGDNESAQQHLQEADKDENQVTDPSLRHHPAAPGGADSSNNS